MGNNISLYFFKMAKVESEEVIFENLWTKCEKTDKGLKYECCIWFKVKYRD